MDLIVSLLRARGGPRRSRDGRRGRSQRVWHRRLVRPRGPFQSDGWVVLEVGTETTSALIAGLFGEASSSQLSALLTAGFVLFLLTLPVNTVAAVFANRSPTDPSPAT